MTSVTRETIAIITALAPHLAQFRALQRAHRKFHLDNARQYLTRSWFRRLDIYKDVYVRIYSTRLPNNNLDGLRVTLYANGEYRITYRIRTKFYGKHVQYEPTGMLRERREYRVADNWPRPTRKWR